MRNCTGSIATEVSIDVRPDSVTRGAEEAPLFLWLHFESEEDRKDVAQSYILILKLDEGERGGMQFDESHVELEKHRRLGGLLDDIFSGPVGRDPDYGAVFSLYQQKKLAQQFFLGIAFGFGGSVGAVLSGQIYGEYLFLVESLITFMAFVILLVHEKRKESITA